LIAEEGLSPAFLGGYTVPTDIIKPKEPVNVREDRISVDSDPQAEAPGSQDDEEDLKHLEKKRKRDILGTREKMSFCIDEFQEFGMTKRRRFD
jgi:hypothetical protein